MDVELKNKGNALFQEGKFEESIELFSQAIELNPSNHVYYSNRSGAYASLENYHQALEDAAKCVELNPSWAKGYVRKGLAQFYLEQVKEAKETYEAGLLIEPTNSQLLAGKAKCEEQDKPNDQFMQQMMLKLYTNPKTAGYMQDPAFVQKLQSIQANPQQAAMHMSDPRIQEAFQVMFSDMGINMDDIKAKAAQQNTTEQQDNKEQDVEFKKDNFFQEEKHQENKPEKKVEKKVEKKENFRDLGNQAYKLKDFETAISHYNTAFDQDNSDVLALNNMAAVYIEMGKLDDALAQCDKAIQSMDDNLCYDYMKRAKVYARKGSVLSKQKDYANSHIFYEKSLLENSDYKVKEEMKQMLKIKKVFDDQNYLDPVKAEEHNEKAKEYFKLGDWVNALKEYTEAIKRNPKEPKYYSNKGVTLMKLMDFPAALSSFEKCLEFDKLNVKALAKKGNCYLMLKEYHKAMTTYEAGLAVEAKNAECLDGMQKTQMKIYSGSGETKEEQEQRAAHGMADPEIQAILRDPTIVNLIRGLQESPNDKHNQSMMRDPDVSAKINKLIAAGVLKTG